MKIAFFDNLPDGGAKRVLREEIKGLSVKHKVSVFSQSRFRLLKIGFRPIDDIIKITTSLFYQFLVAQKINRLQCDVCVVHHDQHTQAPFLLRFLKVKSVYVCQEPLRLVYDSANRIPDSWPLPNKIYEQFYRGLLKRIDKRNIGFANVIIANSDFSRRQIMRCYGVNSHVVYPGIDQTVFRPLNIKKQPYVLFVGGRNNIDGWDRLKKLRPYFAQRKISIKDVYFQKHRNDQEMAKLYNQAICLLALDRQEPFGLKVLEALACGTDVIAMSDGGYPEIAKLYEKYGVAYFSWEKHNEGLINYC